MAVSSVVASAQAGVEGGVIIAHPDAQHSPQSALALQERGLLVRYVSGAFVYKPSSAAGRVVRALPSGLRRRVERQFNRRRFEALDDRLVSSSAVLDLTLRVVDRFMPPSKFGRRLYEMRCGAFERRAARLVVQRRPRVVVAYDDHARRIFDAARRVGACRVLDQSIGHLTQLVEQYEAAGVEHGVEPERVAAAVEEVRAADVIVTSSPYVFDGLVKAGVEAGRVVVLPYGANLERFSPPAERQHDERLDVLYVGHMSARKGVRYVLDAFDSLGGDPRFALTLVGKKVGTVPGFDKARPGVTHRDAIPNVELADVYRAADVFVQMSIHESSAMTIFEALASGLPVVTTPNSGSLVRDGIDGFIVAPRDSLALAERLRQLAGDPALRERMGKAARQRAEQFTWQAYRDRYGALLSDLASASSDEWPAVVAEHRRRLSTVIGERGSSTTASDGASVAGQGARNNR